MSQAPACIDLIIRQFLEQVINVVVVDLNIRDKHTVIIVLVHVDATQLAHTWPTVRHTHTHTSLLISTMYDIKHQQKHFTAIVPGQQGRVGTRENENVTLNANNKSILQPLFQDNKDKSVSETLKIDFHRSHIFFTYKV